MPGFANTKVATLLFRLAPSTKVKHMQVLWNENKKLKELLKEKGHEWNYPKPKEQEED